MRIHYMSDLHLEFGALDKPLPKGEVLVLAGDITLAASLDPARTDKSARAVREANARSVCRSCEVLHECREWARDHREYGFWGGESEEERAAAGYRVDMPVGRVARYPRGEGKPVTPRESRIA